MPAAAAAALFVVYAATLAPGVTFWDAGEFIAAVDVLGIPHPPGTPLYVLLARAASDVLFFLDRALATNLFSALCTAGAGGVTAWLVLRATASRPAALAAALCAGGMSTVWLNATETEVYGSGLLLSLAMIAAGERAGRDDSSRWTVLTVFLIALGAPLHASSLAAAPVAVYLAASDVAGRISWPRGAVLAGGTLIAGGLGTGHWWATGLGVLALAACATGPREMRGLAARSLAVSAAASTAFLYLLVRARHDPAINQANPATRDALLDAMSRAQYDVASLWPREAPIWLQLANIGQYADWQVALGIAPGFEPSAARALATLVFVALGVVGARWHRERDGRSWRAVALLILAGSLGVALWLNLKAGPTIGWGVIPDDAPHEARERDYFFSLAFWGWGIWAGMGAVALASRLTSRGAWLGVAVAALPIALNWRAVDRRAEPGATLPTEFAISLLAAAPNDGVLLVWGDNDTYPLWYQQQVREVRTDVTVVTLPLLRAGWYRAELERRHGLLARTVDRWYGEGETVRELVASARLAGRPIVVASSVPHERRRAYAGELVWAGTIYRDLRADEADGSEAEHGLAPVAGMLVDTLAARHEEWRLEPLLRQPPRRSTDPTARYIAELLECAALAYSAGTDGGMVQADSLATRCNFR